MSTLTVEVTSIIEKVDEKENTVSRHAITTILLFHEVIVLVSKVLVGLPAIINSPISTTRFVFLVN